MTTETAAKKEDADLSYEEFAQIAKDAGMSSSDIARCQRLAALSEAELEAAAERRVQQIGTSTNKSRGLAEEDPSAPPGHPGARSAVVAFANDEHRARRVVQHVVAHRSQQHPLEEPRPVRLGQDPDAADNRWLREAFENRIPIIYFLG